MVDIVTKVHPEKRRKKTSKPRVLAHMLFNGACPKCQAFLRATHRQGRIRIIAFIEDEEVTRPLPSSGIRKLAFA